MPNFRVEAQPGPGPADTVQSPRSPSLPAEDTAAVPSVTPTGDRNANADRGLVDNRDLVAFGAACATLGMFLTITIYLATRLLSALKGGSTMGVESHWGGFGGSVGGWKLSSALSYLIATLVFGGLLISIVWMLLTYNRGANSELDSSRDNHATLTKET
jgi:hypothetical protein